MIALGAVGGHLLLTYFGVEPATGSNPTSPTTSVPQS
jgi:hypothetical protein